MPRHTTRNRLRFCIVSLFNFFTLYYIVSLYYVVFIWVLIILISAEAIECLQTMWTMYCVVYYVSYQSSLWLPDVNKLFLSLSLSTANLQLCLFLHASTEEWRLAVVAMDGSCCWRHRQSFERKFLSSWSCPSVIQVRTPEWLRWWDHYEWLIGWLTSHLTHYRSLNQLIVGSGLNPTRNTPPCYNNATLSNCLCRLHMA